VGEYRASSKISCRKALAEVEESLMRLPGVVGLGIIRSVCGRGYKISVYVSDGYVLRGKESSIPEYLRVPGTEDCVGVEISGIGDIELESGRDLQ